MKKMISLLLALALALSLAACGGKNEKSIDLASIVKLPEETINAHLIGTERDTLLQAWGEPDGMLSGLYGDIYQIPDSDQQIIVYYNDEGLVSSIKIIQQVKSE